ncbi:DUF1801 domain-containing protein [Pseudarthrobacter sp. MDT3-26]|uniref:DUF1801 domain-containing protein n=1 Tax=Pseudarthrobacter raffinosi TaxID=2953651 RepID=UPI00208F5F0E|nr:DUF1801 domain-containing protein [Pseudarthrobacter sp. MDT3-26]MCO4264878.1 DUF1801 domain-containing protein [Pseudarthrobacter sp. MDT3-26]
MTLNRNLVVDSFLESLDQPLKPVIERLRLAVLDADDAITERIKWKAPSFCFESVDRVTFNLRPLHHVQLHRGAKTIEDDFDFDPSKWSGLLEMIGQDRGQVIFPSAEAAAARQEEFVALVREWVRA